MHVLARLLLPALLAAGVALAGCSERSTTLDYAGEEPGVQSETVHCGKDAQFLGGGTVEDGSVRVTVKDAQGQNLFSDVYDDRFDIESEALEGSAGQWTMRIDRVHSGNTQPGADDFEGSYSFTLAC